jgi:hypothetical protein
LMASPDTGGRQTILTIQSTGYWILLCLPASLSSRMVAMLLIQTLENVESVTIRMVVLANEAGRPNVAIQRLRSISLPQNPTQNRRSPYRSHIRTDLLLNNHPSGSNLLQLSLLPTCSRLSSRLRLPPARQDITRMLRVRQCRQRSIRRWGFHLRTKLCTATTLQPTLVHIRILRSARRNQQLGHR